LSFRFILERNVVGEIIVKIMMTVVTWKDINCTRCPIYLQSKNGKKMLKFDKCVLHSS
jgi:hypothetical protein